MRHATAGAGLALLLTTLPALADKPADAKPAEPTGDPADTKPARPPLSEAPPREPLRWGEHLEVGGGLSIVATPGSAAVDGKATNVSLKPGAGFHLRLSWEVFRWLWFTPYLVEARRPLSFGQGGALNLSGVQLEGTAWMYGFGARVSPTLPIGDRVRLWITAGAGWSHLNYSRICPSNGCGTSYVIHERAANFVEVPLGLGAAFEIVPRWLRIHVETTWSLLPSQTGEALDAGQTLGPDGKIVPVTGMPHLTGSFTQLIGLSLVL
jgi:hypothetical protein